MKKKFILLVFILLLGLILVGCNQKENIDYKEVFGTEDVPLTVDEALKIAFRQNKETYSKQEYIVSGFVIDQPTTRNDLEQISFMIVDNINNPKNRIIVLSATSNKDIKKYNKVVVKAYFRIYNDNNVIMTSKSYSDDSNSSCSVLSVEKGLDDGIKKITNSVDTNITVLEITNHLRGRKEHYPISDEFIEKYQQNSGGYIALAKSLGIAVDRQKHSPNQKWHFFESWLQECLEKQTISWEDDAKKNVYTRLLCPELLLWIYEACDVQPTKVRNAMNAAVQGKVNGTNVSTIAKNMRGCVAWEDIATNLKEVIEVTNVTLSSRSLELNVNEEKIILASILPTDATQSATWNVVEGKEYINISQNGNELIITGIKEGTAKIKVTYNANVYAECVVKVIDNNLPVIEGLPKNINIALDTPYILEPVLSKGTGTFIFKSSDEKVVTINSQGVLTTKGYGEAIITVTCLENPEITKDVVVKVVDASVVTSNYKIVYDLGTRKTAKQFETIEELYNAFLLEDGSNNIINAISQMEYIYGGANGGRGETAWYIGNIIKFGTTNVNGSMTINFDSQINYVKITGYVYDNSCKVQMGDSLSTDWEGATPDNKTITTVCSNMNKVSKGIVESAQTTTIEIKFESTTSLKIATINKKPLFITSIEFGYTEE